MLVARLRALDVKDLTFYQQPDKVITYVIVFVRPPLIGFSTIAIGPWLSSNRSIDSLASSGCKKSNTAFVNNAVFAPCAMTTYSASLVERVTQCCVVLLAFTTVPPTITAISDTERLSLPVLV